MNYRYLKIEVIFSYDQDFYDNLCEIKDYLEKYTDSEESSIFIKSKNNRVSILAALYDVGDDEIEDIKSKLTYESYLVEDDNTYIEPEEFNEIDEKGFVDLICKWINEADIYDRKDYIVQLEKLTIDRDNYIADKDLSEYFSKIKAEEEAAQPTVEKTMNKINSLVGLEDFKTYMNELHKMSPILVQYNRNPNYPTQHLLFAVDYGNGSSSALRLLYEYLSLSKLFYLGSNHHVEASLSFAELNVDAFDSATMPLSSKMENLKSTIEDYRPGVVGLHIEEWMTKLEDNELTLFLDFCVRYRHQICFVFIIPLIEDSAINRVYKRISDVLNVKTIKFLPYTDNQLMKVIK